MNVQATFDRWTNGRAVPFLGTNTGAPSIPFQTWRRFKEAFAPELIARAVAESEIPVHQSLDPFGGSGTTALASQFLGVVPTTIEVNPYLADLIEAKLTQYDPDALARDLGRLVSLARSVSEDDIRKYYAPETFVEPGVKGRWIFDLPVWVQLCAIRTAIENIAADTHQRLFRALLGGVIVEASNVVISGKGRRYRRGWDKRKPDQKDIMALFCSSARTAISEIHAYSNRPVTEFCLIRGDSRKELSALRGQVDVCIFSPPYPNSFDYTDVYNVELWGLGYIGGKEDNSALRNSTLCSHVQVLRTYPAAPTGSNTLDLALSRLNGVRKELWSQWIPDMVGGYFSDLRDVLVEVRRLLANQGKVWMIVGDSRYRDVYIDVSKILQELAPLLGFAVVGVEPFRSMRASPQQGGRPELAETLIILSAV